MLLVLLLGQVITSIDGSIANVAGPSIRRSMELSGAQLQLVIGAYILAYGVLLVIGARLGEDYGPARLFALGVGLFTLASLVCGLAPSTALLIGARAVQGIGAALLVPQVLSLIQRHFEGRERARALGYYSLILAAGVSAGQVLGGAIVGADLLGLGWRPAFLLNVPVGIGLLLAGRALLPRAPGTGRRRLDLAGVAALCLPMLAIMLALMFGREAGWAAWTWVALLLGLLGLAGFLAIERAVARRGGNPVLDPAVLAPHGIKSGLAVVFVLMGQYGGFLFVVTLHLQTGLGFGTLAAGLTFCAYALGFALVNLNWARLPEGVQRRTPGAALLALALANLLFGLSVMRGWNPWAALPLLFAAGAGHGAGYGPLVNQMTLRVRERDGPALSGLVTTATMLAEVVGVAALGSLYLGALGPDSPTSSGAALALVAFAIAVAALLATLGAVRLARTPRPRGR